MGLIKVIPLKIHGWIELIVSIVLIGVAFWLGREEGALSRNFYFGFALAVFITWVLAVNKQSLACLKKNNTTQVSATIAYIFSP